jgi:ribosomal protein S18 acetylase RimI-like enzyme
MLTYRTFRNFDPPTVISLWRSRAGQFGLLQPVSPDLFEQLVFGKLYFDYNGLILALDDGQPVGFAHAGFGPNDRRDWISTDAGVICVVVVRPGCAESEVAAGLIDRCEQYLRGRGAKTIFGGGLTPLNPFYMGLYGGSELPGVLDSDTLFCQALASRGYRQLERTSLMRRELGGFESLVDRRQMHVRRQMMVEVTADAPTRSWWEASILGEFDVTRFDLVPRGGGTRAATTTFRSMEANGANSAGRSAGLVEVFVEESYRRRGLAIFVLCEAFRQFLRQGIMHVDVQANQSNTAAIEMFRKLGFQQVEQAGLWRKDL